MVVAMHDELCQRRVHESDILAVLSQFGWLSTLHVLQLCFPDVGDSLPGVTSRSLDSIGANQQRTACMRTLNALERGGLVQSARWRIGSRNHYGNTWAITSRGIRAARSINGVVPGPALNAEVLQRPQTATDLFAWNCQLLLRDLVTRLIIDVRREPTRHLSGLHIHVASSCEVDGGQGPDISFVVEHAPASDYSDRWRPWRHAHVVDIGSVQCALFLVSDVTDYPCEWVQGARTCNLVVFLQEQNDHASVDLESWIATRNSPPSVTFAWLNPLLSNGWFTTEWARSNGTRTTLDVILREHAEFA